MSENKAIIMENIPITRTEKMDDIPNHMDEILNDIRRGKEIVLTEHDRVIAKITPVSNAGEPEKWPDFYGRAVALFGKSPTTSACDSLTETREERF